MALEVKRSTSITITDDGGADMYIERNDGQVTFYTSGNFDFAPDEAAVIIAAIQEVANSIKPAEKTTATKKK